MGVDNRSALSSHSAIIWDDESGQRGRRVSLCARSTAHSSLDPGRASGHRPVIMSSEHTSSLDFALDLALGYPSFSGIGAEAVMRIQARRVIKVRERVSFGF